MDKTDIPNAQVVKTEGGSVFAGLKGVIFRQDAQDAEVIAQAVGLPCEKANRFKAAPLPADKRAIRRIGDREGWKPNQREIDMANYTINMQEESSCFQNFLFYCAGCVHLRPFTMHMAPMGQAQGEYMLDRPFTCGGGCCCPHTISLHKNGQVVGRVVEDWDCSNYCCRYWQLACCCKVPYNVQLLQNGQMVNRYNISVNTCCCGPNNNFCGATPCKNDMLFNVYNYTSGGVDRNSPAGYIQKTYGNSGSLLSLYRFCCASASQYLIEWPADATDDEKALFISTVTLIEYMFFENKGD